MSESSSPPTGERRRVTALFADLSGFTELTSGGDPETVAGLLNAWFELAQRTITAHGGRTEKYIGDCVMALFGAPETLERAAERAADTALALREEARQLFHDRGLADQLDLHIGINSGVVLAGEIRGPDGGIDFRALGDAVNIGARLEGAAAAGEILVGEETRFLLSREFQLGAPRDLQLKGKAEAVAAAELLGRKEANRSGGATDDAAGHFGRFSSALVGRDAEVSTLRAHAQRALGEPGQVVLLEGEAGMGKSRLVAELARLEPLASANLLEARSREGRETTPYHPFADLLANLAGMLPEASPPENLERLGAALDALEGIDATASLPFLGTLAGLPVDDDPNLSGLAPEALERLIARAMRNLLRALSAEGPLVLFFEDIHHADTSSLRLLEELAGSILDGPVLLLLAARPEIERSSLRLRNHLANAPGVNFHQLALTPLPESESAQLVRNLLAGGDLPDPVARRIAERTDGNPFFIEEVVRWLADQGVLTVSGGRAEVQGSLESVEIPASVQDMIRLRFDTLVDEQRAMLRAASVIGRRVSPEILSSVLAENFSAATLDELVAREYLRRGESRSSASRRRILLQPQQELTFVHALMQETIYASLLKSEASALHAATAAAIERVHGERLEDFLPMLALHHARAGNATQAEEYLFAAGEAASRTAASHEALHYFREAARLYLETFGDAAEPEKLARLETQIGLALQNCGELGEAVPCFDRALGHLGVRPPRSSGLPDLALLLAAVRSFRDLVLRRGRPPQRPATDRERWILEIILERARCLMPSNPRAFVETGVFGLARMLRCDPRSLPRAMTLYGEGAILFAFAGLFGVSRRLIRAAAWASDDHNDSHAFALTFMRFACDYFEGQWRSISDVEPALLDRALQRGEFWSVDTFRGLDAERLIFRGRFADAARHIAGIEELVDDYGYAFSRKNRVYLRTLAALQKRDLAAAREYARERKELSEVMPRILATATLAQAEAIGGDLERTREILGELRELREQAGQLRPMHAGLSALAELQAAIAGHEVGSAGPNTLEAAERAARAALGKYGRTRAELLRLLGTAEFLRGRETAARRTWQKALRAAQDLRMPVEEARILAEMHARLADPEPAWQQTAREVFEKHELEWDLARLPRLAKTGT